VGRRVRVAAAHPLAVFLRKLYGACPAAPTNTAASPLPLACGGGVSSYLMDIPKSARLPIEPPFATNKGTVHHWRSNIYSVYIQDDWKMFRI